MVHRGEILQKAVEESKVKIKDLADYMGVHRTTLNNWYKTPDLPFEVLIRIGKYIRHDFNKDFKYSTEFIQAKEVNEEQEQYGKPIDFKEKYLKLLEDQNMLLRKGEANYNQLAEAIVSLSKELNAGTKDLSESLLQIARTLDKGHSS